MKDKIFTLLIAAFLLVGLYFSITLNDNLISLRDRVDRQNVEYQFVISDKDSITVFDKERFVGVVKLQGQLDSLIIKDNQ